MSVLSVRVCWLMVGVLVAGPGVLGEAPERTEGRGGGKPYDLEDGCAMYKEYVLPYHTPISASRGQYHSGSTEIVTELDLYTGRAFV